MGLIGFVTYIKDGFFELTPAEYQSLTLNAKSSPFRAKCHISEYHEPAKSCEYFEGKVSWATFGDSHSTEISYALADNLRKDGVGLKQFSFSGCRPSYQEVESFSKCSKWYNESVKYILDDSNIKNIVFIHRFTDTMFNDGAFAYPAHSNAVVTSDVTRMTAHMDQLIEEFASHKENVYVFYPIPELQRNIN